MKRRTAREKALQCLYQLEFSEEKVDFLLNKFFLDSSSPRIRDFIKEIAIGAAENRHVIDEYISNNAYDWRIERMSYVDRNILRIAIYEMLYIDDIPYSVSIDEAVELAKKFSTPRAASFINGILDSIKREIVENKD